MESTNNSQTQYIPVSTPILFSSNSQCLQNKLEDQAKEFKNYIILNNINLEKQRKKDEEKIKKLEKELDIKDKEIDSNDNKTRYIKGLLQNLIIIKDWYIKQNISWKKLNKVYEDSNKDIFKITYKSSIFVTLFNLILFGFQIQYFESYLYISLYNILLSILFIYCIYNLQLTFISSREIDKKFKTDRNSIIIKIKTDVEECNQLEKETISLDNWINEV
tara:strand:+ start:989 stop:1645 length:657 start_codon:yes stop_codon:yes gene_type:complete